MARRMAERVRGCMDWLEASIVPSISEAIVVIRLIFCFISVGMSFHVWGSGVCF